MKKTKQTYQTLAQATKFPKKHVVNLALLNFDLDEHNLLSFIEASLYQIFFMWILYFDFLLRI